MKHFAIILVLAALIISMPAAQDAEAQQCFELSPFCDQIFVWVDVRSGVIEGWDNNCGVGECNFGVVGQIVGSSWVVFFDYSIERCRHQYDYGIMTGTGFNGSLQRYFADTSRNPDDPVAITLIPCAAPTSPAAEDRGPTGG